MKNKLIFKTIFAFFEKKTKNLKPLCFFLGVLTGKKPRGVDIAPPVAQGKLAQILWIKLGASWCIRCNFQIKCSSRLLIVLYRDCHPLTKSQ